MNYDGFGNIGLILDYTLIVFFSGSTLILFLYFWKKKRLDFDEDPKYQMFNEGE